MEFLKSIKTSFSLLFLALILSLSQNVGAQTTIPGGPVKGIWKPGGSPYYITGDIWVNISDTLVIRAGVEVFFVGTYYFKINGLLQANGTAENMITFHGGGAIGSWKGLSFAESATAGCILDYCNIKDAGYSDCSCIYTLNNNKSVTISNSDIHDCANIGIYIHAYIYTDWGKNITKKCNPTITNNNIYNNGSHGIYVHAFYRNDGGDGNDNSSIASPIIKNNVIYNNKLDGIHCYTYANGGYYDQVPDRRSNHQTNPEIQQNSIYGNRKNGIYCYKKQEQYFKYIISIEANPLITSNIISTSSEYGLNANNTVAAEKVKYNDFWENLFGDFKGINEGLGVIVKKNLNGDPCDFNWNIFLDPQFANTSDCDFSLKCASPCINAGDLSLPWDLDGSRPDIGAIPFTGEKIPFNPLAPETAYPGEEELWVNIEVGSSDYPVTDLKVVSFEFKYTNTTIIDYVDYEVGPFLPDSLATVIPDDQNGKISASVYSNSGGNSGHGIVLRLKFKVLGAAYEGQIINWSFTDILANNSGGNTINLCPSDSKTVIREPVPMSVWPGDADNNGIVNIFDINTIVIYFNKTGPTRPNASIQWIAQSCQPWNPVAATYADCDGNGKVDIFDINAVVINFGKTHTSSNALFSSDENVLNQSLSEDSIFVKPRDYDDITHDFWVDINVGKTGQAVNDLKIVSFELTYSNTENIEFVSYQVGNFPSEAQAQVIPEDSIGKISASIFRISGGESGNGTVLTLKFNSEKGNEIVFSFVRVLANNSNGDQIPLSYKDTKIITSVKNELSNIIPDEFALHQNHPNPFNPETYISYQVPKTSQVKIEVFNLLGQHIRTLVDEEKSPGSYKILWNGLDDQRQAVSSGVYLYKMQAGDFTAMQKMVLVR